MKKFLRPFWASLLCGAMCIEFFWIGSVISGANIDIYDCIPAIIFSLVIGYVGQRIRIQLWKEEQKNK